MTPLKQFESILAWGGGLAVSLLLVGIVAILLACLWFYFTGGNANKGG